MAQQTKPRKIILSSMQQCTVLLMLLNTSLPFRNPPDQQTGRNNARVRKRSGRAVTIPVHPRYYLYHRLSSGTEVAHQHNSFFPWDITLFFKFTHKSLQSSLPKCSFYLLTKYYLLTSWFFLSHSLQLFRILWSFLSCIKCEKSFMLHVFLLWTKYIDLHCYISICSQVKSMKLS